MAHQYYEGSNKPINAYSMADMERLTRGAGNAEFARRKGAKDKKKRMSRGTMAAIGAGSLAGAGAIGAGIRYGGAELRSRKAGKELAGLREKAGLGGTVDSAESQRLARQMRGGAKGRFRADVQAAKDLGSRIKNYDYKGTPGRAWESAKRAGKALQTKSGVGDTNAGWLREPVNRLGNVWKSGKAGQAGLVGAGLLGASAVAGGGYAAYKALKKRKNRD